MAEHTTHITKEVKLERGPQRIRYAFFDTPEFEEILQTRFYLENLQDPELYAMTLLQVCCPSITDIGSKSNSDIMKIYEAAVELLPWYSFETVQNSILVDWNFLHNSEPSKQESQKEKRIPKVMESTGELEARLRSLDFRDLFEVANSEVKGQKRALHSIISRLIAFKHRGFGKGLHTVYLAGPSGVGKTSTVECLAEYLGVPMLQIFGSEYTEGHTTTNLFGAPKSFVGYKEGGVLPNFVSKNSQGIILLDESDKMHPRVWESLTNLLDKGYVTTKEGTPVFFKGIVYMTSNTGNKASEGSIGKHLGFAAERPDNSSLEKDRILAILRREGMSEAILGRIDDWVLFGALSPLVLSEIVLDYVGEVNGELGYFQIGLTENAITELVRLGDPDNWGARNLFKNVDKYVIGETCTQYELMGLSCRPTSTIKVDFQKDTFLYYLSGDVFHIRTNN